jgi:hypothetical protein
MSATWRNVAYFHPDRGNLATWFLVCQHTFVSRFSNIDVQGTDDIWSSVLLIPTLMVIYITAPPNKKPQKIIRRLHPLTLRLHLLPRRPLTLHPLCLFVCLSVCLFLWLVVASSLYPLSSRPIPSHRRAMSLRYISSLVVRLVVVKSSCPRVVASSRRRVVASRLASSLYRAP